MGSAESKSTVVHVHIEKPFYYSGDIVAGAMVLHVTSPMQVNKINLKVTGVEKTHWQERHGSGSNSYTENYNGKHVVFKTKLPVMGEGFLQPGDYQWPFTFQLPPNCPGSFNYCGGHTRASIVYKVKADVDQAGLLKPDFKKTACFEVLQRNKATEPPAPVAMAKEEKISYWCCFNKGQIGLKVAVDSNIFLPGDGVHLKAQLDNKSTVDVPHLEFRLHQKMHLKAKTLFSERTHKFTVTRICHKQQMPGFPNGAAGSTSHYEAALALDRSLEATCHGQIITSTYELEVVAKTGCCLSEVALKQPLLLNDPQPSVAPQQLAPPPGWAPQIYPTVEVQLPMPEGYAPCFNAAPQYNQGQMMVVQAGSPQFPHQQPQLQQPQQPQQPAPVTYNITNVTYNYNSDGGQPPQQAQPGLNPAMSEPLVVVSASGAAGVPPAKMLSGDIPVGWTQPPAASALPMVPGTIGYA